jgi:hypothetical protein
MPYISTKTNTSIPKDKEIKIKNQMGKAIELLPGKSESWLMLSFEEECHLYFKGESDKDIAYVEVKLFGKSTKEAYDKLTYEIKNILHEELNIATDHIYVKYEEVSHWGYNGHNF